MLVDAFETLWALSAFHVAVETELLAALSRGRRDAAGLAAASELDPLLTGRVLDVLAAVGIAVRDGAEYALTDEGMALASRGRALRADLTVTFGLTRAFVQDARRGALAPGWRHANADVIRAQGELSYAMTKHVLRGVADVWPDVDARLSRPAAVMIDVGAGAAGSAIAFCQHYRHLRVVGLEPLRAALAEARANVAFAGLEERIELRAARGEEITEEGAYDVAFFADDVHG